MLTAENTVLHLEKNDWQRKEAAWQEKEAAWQAEKQDLLAQLEDLKSSNRTQVKQEAPKPKRQKRQKALGAARQMFAELDTDGSGEITRCAVLSYECVHAQCLESRRCCSAGTSCAPISRCFREWK